MADIYVDIDNAYIATGDGSSGSPLNWTQFLDHYYYLESSADYYIKGKHLLDTPYDWLAKYKKVAEKVVRFKSWDTISYGPWIVYGAYEWGIETDNQAYAQLEISDLCVSTTEFTLSLFNQRSGKTTCQHMIRNSSFKCEYLMVYSDRYATNSAKFLGCTFECGTGSSGNFFMYELGGIDYQDCLFDGLVASSIYFDFYLPTVSFTRCYFTCALTDMVWREYATWRTLSELTLLDCTAGFSLLQALTDPSDATVANKDAFSYILLGLPTITDPAITAEWSSGGYSTGFFGESRLSIGAFYFPVYVEPPSIEILATPKVGVRPMDVSFDMRIISGSYISFHWDFGDGQFSTEAAPTHTYRTTGYHTVVLVATKGDGSTTTVFEPGLIRVGEISFVATPSWNDEIPTSVVFTNTSAAPTGYELTHWNWDFGNMSLDSGATGPTHIYGEYGSFNVILSARIEKI